MENAVNLYILLSLFFLPISDSLRITQGDAVCRGQCGTSTTEERPWGLAAPDSASLWGKPAPLWVTATDAWVWPAAPDKRLHSAHTHQTTAIYPTGVRWQKSTIFFLLPPCTLSLALNIPSIFACLITAYQNIHQNWVEAIHFCTSPSIALIVCVSADLITACSSTCAVRWIASGKKWMFP